MMRTVRLLRVRVRLAVEDERVPAVHEAAVRQLAADVRAHDVGLDGVVGGVRGGDVARWPGRAAGAASVFTFASTFVAVGSFFDEELAVGVHPPAGRRAAGALSKSFCVRQSAGRRGRGRGP